MIKRKVFSRIGLSLFLMVSLAVVSSGLLLTLLPSIFKSAVGGMLASYVGMYLLGLPVLLGLTKKLPRTTRKVQAQMSGLQLVKAYVICLGGMYLVNISYTVIIGLLTGKNGNQVGMNISQMSLLSTLLIVVIFAPIIEELIFRKLMYQLTADYGEKTYLLVSALTFSLFHMNLGQGLYAFWIGLVLAAIYYRTGNIVYPIILHIIINFTGSLVPTLINGNQTGMIFLAVFIVVTVILSIVLTISAVKKRKQQVRLKPELQKRVPLKDLFLNVGMVVYVLFCLFVIIFSLVMS